MTTQPVTQTQVLTGVNGTLDAVAGYDLIWGPLGNGDTGQPVILPGNADRSFQVVGTFGAGGAIQPEGSNDGVNFYQLTDPTGTPISMTAAGIKAITEGVQWVRPHVTAGDGTTSLTVTMFCRQTQWK